MQQEKLKIIYNLFWKITQYQIKHLGIDFICGALIFFQKYHLINVANLGVAGWRWRDGGSAMMYCNAHDI